MTDLDYWQTQVQAYLDENTDLDVLALVNDAKEVQFPAGKLDEDDRVALVNRMQRAGFTIQTSRYAEIVAVATPDEPLDEPFGGDE